MHCLAHSSAPGTKAQPVSPPSGEKTKRKKDFYIVCNVYSLLLLKAKRKKVVWSPKLGLHAPSERVQEGGQAGRSGAASVTLRRLRSTKDQRAAPGALRGWTLSHAPIEEARRRAAPGAQYGPHARVRCNETTAAGKAKRCTARAPSLAFSLPLRANLAFSRHAPGARRCGQAAGETDGAAQGRGAILALRG